MQSLIETFYTAFDALDAEAMAACYHPDIRFEDPAFGVLTGAQAGNMWRMLCQSQQGKSFSVAFSEVKTEGSSGQARWEAHYHYGQRPVHNRITAQFEFAEGKIIRHTDRFDLYRWARQALGLTGWLIGWTPFFRKQLQKQARQRLARFEARRAQ
ncbi:MAG: nuclear transport factor 2 family protein [Bacteroidetes bacterium]|nr:MAG: nuclear transport factor 2 family protein [Bacteroidota bacterium]